MSAERRVHVHFACNDWRDGSFAGRVGNCSIGRGKWDFDLTHDEVAFTVEYERMRFRIHRHWFQFKAAHEWIGNWCWNGYVLSHPHAMQLINILRLHGWHCEGGTARVCDWYDGLATKTNRPHPTETVAERVE